MTLPFVFNVFRARIEQSLSYLNRSESGLVCQAFLKHVCKMIMLLRLSVVGDGRAQLSPAASQTGFGVALTSAVILLNDGNGHFSPDASLMGRFITDFTDVEALDLNADGRPDLGLLGADEGYGQLSIVLLNDGSGSFANVRPVALPPARMANPAPQDLVFVDGALYVSQIDGSAHAKRIIRRIAWPGLQSTIVYEGDERDSLGTSGRMLTVRRNGWTQVNSDCMPNWQGLALR
jgi:hypothetical protein